LEWGVRRRAWFEGHAKRHTLDAAGTVGVGREA
jgi:hypothetical protein